MNYLVKPDASISPMGSCSCTSHNQGYHKESCLCLCIIFNNVCVTPTGTKLSPQGIDTLE